MSQIKLPVDVHLAVGSDGMMLVIGGLILKTSAAQLEEVLMEKPLKNGRRKAKVKEKPSAKGTKASSDKAAERRAAGLCRFCSKKATKGKRVCKEHLAVYQQRAADALALKNPPAALRKVA